MKNNYLKVLKPIIFSLVLVVLLYLFFTLHFAALETIGALCAVGVVVFYVVSFFKAVRGGNLPSFLRSLGMSLATGFTAVCEIGRAHV